MSSQIDESGRATWLFAGASGDQIALAVEAAEPLDTIALFEPDGSLLAEATGDKELAATLNMDGWYGLRLDGRPGSEYQLHLAVEPALPCTESCPDLHYGETINAHLAAGELFVMLDFVGHAEDEVVVRVEDGADKRWMVQLYGPDAERVPCQPLMAESTVLCSLVADGRHLAVVSPASNETEAAFDIQLEASRP